MSNLKIEWADITVHTTDSNIIEIENIRFDLLELTDTYLKFRDLDDVWYVIPMDTLLYYTYKIRRE